MELLHKWNHISLVKRIIVGLILGAALGALLPQASVIGILGTLFVNAFTPSLSIKRELRATCPL